MTPPTCKCCGAATEPFASIDFSRTCEDQPVPVFAPTGEAVPYFRCTACGFLFTPHFDGLTTEQMAEKIYNSQYVMADPEFVDSRPRYFAGILQAAIGSAKDAVAALDFGGGNGQLAALMCEAGFRDFANYDPFFGSAVAPASSYDLITAFEVMEHTRDPIGTFREALALLRPDGALLFSTVLQPRQLDASWWYIAPRNGHVSLHSRRSLLAIAQLLQMEFLSVSAGLHLFYRSPPNLVMRSIVQHYARPMLRFASLNGIGPLLNASRQIARSGAVGATLDPRHAGRALLRQLGVAIER
jgi:2-polyprenyl-6-hydroxyphenyl methylase/3-demethylubiquinone-9 3-methyltransferase